MLRPSPHALPLTLYPSGCFDSFTVRCYGPDNPVQAVQNVPIVPVVRNQDRLNLLNGLNA